MRNSLVNVLSILIWQVTVDNMVSKGLWTNSFQDTRKIEADYKSSNTAETLIGYIVCCQHFLLFQSNFPFKIQTY